MYELEKVLQNRYHVEIYQEICRVYLDEYENQGKIRKDYFDRIKNLGENI